MTGKLDVRGVDLPELDEAEALVEQDEEMTVEVVDLEPIVTMRTWRRRWGESERAIVQPENLSHHACGQPAIYHLSV